jgi:hypothetical protein
MSLQTFLQNNRRQVLGALNSGVDLAVRTVLQKSATVGEVPFVSALTQQGAKHWISRIGLIPNPTMLSWDIWSCFIHKSPQIQDSVKSRGPHEAGDLLLAHIHTDSAGVQSRNALMLQAKICTSVLSQLRLSGMGDLNQFQTYSTWPPFQIVKPADMAPTRIFDFHPKQPHPEVQYLLIEHQPVLHLGTRGSYAPRVRVATAFNPLAPGPALDKEVFRLLEGRAGRGFGKSDTNGIDPWTDFVLLLLSKTGAGTYLNASSSSKRLPSKGGGDVPSRGTPNPPKDEGEPPSPDFGPSVILIRTTESEFESSGPEMDEGE